MANVGHIIYKADDLENSINYFRSRGFDVEPGQQKNAASALIYFCEGPYLEIRERADVPPFFRQLLHLTGTGKFVDSYDRFATMSQGYSRVVLEAQRKEFDHIKEIFDSHQTKSLTIPFSRKDPAGRRLACWCLSPDDWAIPLFVTPFAIDTHRSTPHPNGITHITDIDFAASEKTLSICKHVGVDGGLTCRSGTGTIDLEFA